jgi:Restriction Enzyme Adenine Methylase Associated
VGQQPRAGWTPVSGAERHVTLQDVMASGRLPAGSRLEADYRGQHHTAELLADGHIRLAGQTHRTLSSAGGAVKRAVLGPDIPKSVYSTDGWVFWRATDARAGDTATLRVIRQRVAGDDTA